MRATRQQRNSAAFRVEPLDTATVLRGFVRSVISLEYSGRDAGKGKSLSFDRSGRVLGDGILAEVRHDPTFSSDFSAIARAK
jgi:hypothetical protein